LNLSEEEYNLVWRLIRELGYRRPKDFFIDLIMENASRLDREFVLRKNMRRVERILGFLRDAYRLYWLNKKVEVYNMKAQETEFEPIIVLQHQLDQQLKQIINELKQLYKEEADRIEREAYRNFEKREFNKEWLKEAYENGYRYVCLEHKVLAPSLVKARDLGFKFTKTEYGEIRPMCYHCNKPMERIEDLLRENYHVYCYRDKCYEPEELVLIEHENLGTCISPPDKYTCLERVVPYYNVNKELEYVELEDGTRLPVRNKADIRLY